MNDLEKALNGTDEDIDTYLEITSTKKIREDVIKIRNEFSDKEAIKRAINFLKEVLK